MALAELERRVARSWSQVVAGAPWSAALHLGTASLASSAAEARWPELHRGALAWDVWERTAPDGVRLTRRTVRVHRTDQPLPATLHVASLEAAANLLGEGWARRVARARARHVQLVECFPDVEDPAGVLRAVDTWSDVDVDVLWRTASWFAGPHPSGLTARQVPVEGLGTRACCSIARGSRRGVARSWQGGGARRGGVTAGDDNAVQVRCDAARATAGD
nr:DUF3322 domain-containing protein [Nocardioides flavescens]